MILDDFPHLSPSFVEDFHGKHGKNGGCPRPGKILPCAASPSLAPHGGPWRWRRAVWRRPRRGRRRGSLPFGAKRGKAPQIDGDDGGKVYGIVATL